VEVIESSLCHLKGKHNSTKARMLMEALAGGKLFNGEAAKAMSQKSRCYMKNLFRPWKLVKAADVAAVSTFKSARRLQHIFRTKVFGTENSSSQWRLQYERDSATGSIALESVQLRNNAA
jgi:hypothetical protein